MDREKSGLRFPLLKWLALGTLLILFAAAAAGCSRSQEEQPKLEAGEYWIYYLNSSSTRLVPYAYRPQATDPEELIAELMDQIRTVPADLDCQPPLSERVVYQNCRWEDQVLYLYFDANYTSMKADQEILYRAALTLMLTQVNGVEYINIYCGDQPLMDRNQNPVGMLAASDFIMGTSNVNSYEKVEMTLYFADESGSSLVPERREVIHDMNTSSMEQLIVEQLIAGPEQEGLRPVLPEGLKVLNLSVNDSVCYINFDATFLEGVTDVSEYLPIYAIVNSLTELTTVTRVRILVNGSQDVMFRDVVSLNTAFERNEQYMEEEQP